MNKSKYINSLALLLAVQVAAVACAEAGRGKQRRQPIQRNKNTGLLKDANKTASSKPKVSSPEDPETNNGSAKNAKTAPLPNQNDTKIKSNKIKAMKAQVTEYIQGTAVEAQKLAEGLYSLEEVVSHLEFQDSTRGDHVGLISIYTNRSLQLDKTKSDNVGIMSNTLDEGRSLIIPYKFFVKSLNGQPWQPKRDQSVSEVVFKTVAESKPGSMSLNDSFQNGADVLHEVSLIETMGKTPGTIDSQTAYEAIDERGKKIYLRLIVGSEDKLRMLVTVLEKGENLGSAKNSESEYLRRTMIFVFARQQEPIVAAGGNEDSPKPKISKTVASEVPPSTQPLPVTTDL